MNTMARNTDPDSSHEAAESINVTKDCKLALHYFRIFVRDKGLTGPEFRDLLKYSKPRLNNRKQESLRRRLSDLLKQGILFVTNERRGGKPRIMFLTTGFDYRNP